MRWVLLSLLVVGLVGCTSAPTTGPKEKDHTVKGSPHGEHDEPGPHGGTIFHFGVHHGEFKPDHGKKEVTVWILADDEKSPQPIDAEKLQVNIDGFKTKDKTVEKFEMELKATPQEGDPKGKSSRFVGTHDNIAIEAEYSGRVIGPPDKPKDDKKTPKPNEGKFSEKSSK